MHFLDFSLHFFNTSVSGKRRVLFAVEDEVSAKSSGTSTQAPLPPSLVSSSVITGNQNNKSFLRQEHSVIQEVTSNVMFRLVAFRDLPAASLLLQKSIFFCSI